MSSQENTSYDFEDDYTPEREREDALMYEAFGHSNEFEAHYYNCEAGYFAHPDASQCGCQGTGYYLSQVDTWHECPVHHVPGQPHPEDNFEDFEEEAETTEAQDTVPAPPPAFDPDSDDIPF